MVRQRQEPLTSPADGACAAGPSTASIADASPVPPEPLASPSAFCLASPSAARRPLSKSDAWSCQPADAAVAVNASAVAASASLSVFTRMRFFPFAVRTVGSIPSLQVRRRRHADHAVTGVNHVNLAGDGGREIAEQVGGGAADLVERDVHLERAVRLVP